MLKSQEAHHSKYWDVSTASGLAGGMEGPRQGYSSPCALDVVLPILHSIWGSFCHAPLSLQVATSPLRAYWHTGRDCGRHESKIFA